MVGGLLYLMVSHLEITYSVGVYARYQSNFSESKEKVVKHVLGYVNGITNHVLLRNRDTSATHLVGYSNVD